VKCGLEKPTCLRCVHFGVACDGYEFENGERKNWSTVVPQRRALLLPKACYASFAKDPSKALFSTDQDYQYFDIFCNKTAFQILPYYDAGIFRQMLLQACVSEPSLRHAVVALGALDMKEESLEEFKSLSLEEKSKSPHVHHLNALREYSVAISKMRVSTPPSVLIRWKSFLATT
jgi:Fungal specific transcription factor domain